jgi:hypothetical protein
LAGIDGAANVKPLWFATSAARLGCDLTLIESPGRAARRRTGKLGRRENFQRRRAGLELSAAPRNAKSTEQFVNKMCKHKMLR